MIDFVIVVPNFMLAISVFCVGSIYFRHQCSHPSAFFARNLITIHGLLILWDEIQCSNRLFLSCHSHEIVIRGIDE